MFSLLFGSLASDLVPVAEQFIPFLQSEKEYSTIPRDGRYALDMEPVFQALARSIQHRDKTISQSFYEYSPKRITGSFKFDSDSRKLYIELFLFNEDSLLTKSKKIDITNSISEAIPDHHYLFDGGIEENRIIFQGVVGDRIQEYIRNNRIPALLIQNDKFAITGANRTSLNWREEIIIERLNNLVGVKQDRYSPAQINFDSTGNLHITTGTSHQTLPNLVRYSSNIVTRKRHGYLTPVQGHTAFQYERTTPSIPMEHSIINDIEFFFKSDYPNLFSNFSRNKLLSLFPQRNYSSILSGSVKRDTKGNEFVNYKWVTPNHWVGKLEQIQNGGGKFRVKCRVHELIQDPHAPHRFWAVVHQQWRTMNSVGKERYSDEGFLLVNFDFTPQGKIHEVKLHYRLWFYSYPNNQSLSSSFRRNSISKDVSEGLGKISGIDASLKSTIKESIIQSMAM